VLAASPEFTLPLRVLAFSYLRTGRPSDAVELLRESTERVPDTYLVRSLAKVLILEERYQEAEEALATYRLLDPLDGRVPLLLGDIRSRQGRPDQALVLYRQALELDENRVGVDARGRIADMEARPGE
jgi:Flp pilus assembly protein TadD